MTIEDINLDETDAVIFDLDGTLYDKRGLVRRIIIAELGITRLPILARERLARRKFGGLYFGSEEAFWDNFFLHMGMGKKCLANRCRTWYKTDYMPTMIRTLKQHFQVREWVTPLFEALAANGKKIAIYSDYGEVGFKMMALGMDLTMADVVVSASELGGLKPAPECMKAVIEMLGVPPERCLMVGDRDDNDGGSARAVGAKFMKVNS